MGPTAHSVLGPSKGELIVHCPPSFRLSEGIDEEASEYALSGTAAHELAEYKGRKILGLPAGSRPVSDFDSDEMEEATDEYADLLRDRVDQLRLRCPDPLILFETRVTMGDFVPDSFGTSDFLAVSDDELLVVDFKYGYQEISAIENVQMRMYALGATLQLHHLYDFTAVTMVICQPRIHNTSTWSITLAELLDWAEHVLKPAAALAAKGEGDFSPGPWCTKYYCRARTRCRARCEELLRLAQLEFKPAPLLSDEELACVMDKADDLAKWSEEIFAYATAQAVSHGKTYPGWKLVTGRSVTKLADESGAVNAAHEAGLTDDQLYKKSLVTLTELKKLLGKDRYEELILPFTKKSTPKLTLTRETDRREAVSRGAADDFTD